MIAQLTPDYIQRRPLQAARRLVGYGLFEGRAMLQRGRWINPLVFAHFAVEARLPQLRRVERPAYIVGLGRSGTTILSHLLSFHRAIGSLNEPKALWHAVYPGEDLIGSYTTEPARYRLGAEDATADVRRRAHRLYGAYLLATGTRRVVDKYPELVFRVPFVRAIFPDARFLILVRNGWDVVTSIANWSTKHGAAQNGRVENWWGRDDRKWRLLAEQVVPGDPDLGGIADEIRGLTGEHDRAAVEWITAMNEGARWLRELPEAFVRVNYEDLVRDPDAELTRIFEFIGVERDPAVIEYARGELSAPKPRPPVELHTALCEPFSRALARTGYTVA